MSNTNCINDSQWFTKFHDYKDIFGFDFTDTEEIDSIIKMSATKLIERNGLKYLPKLQTPFSGWLAKFYKCGRIKSIRHFNNGVQNGTSVKWKLEEDVELLLESAKIYKNNKVNGACVITNWLLDASTEEGFMEGDLKCGKWSELYGNIKCEYKAGNLHGEYIEETDGDCGTRDEECLYNFSAIKNLPEEPKIVYEKGIFQNGKRGGRWLLLLDSIAGRLTVVGNYENDLPNGYWGLYIGSNQERIVEEGKMLNGKKQGTWIVNPNSSNPQFSSY